ncbi:MAG: hypothetical protein GY909_16620 [Oligoflexia bacterium]|nr:hypothetical protein [Oligoflexia bacterium]
MKSNTWILILALLFTTSLSASELISEVSDCTKSEISLDPIREIISELDPKLKDISIVAGQAAWTEGDKFEGDIIIFSMNAQLGQTQAERNEDGSETQYFIGRLSSETQMGVEGLQHQYLKVSAITREEVKALENDGRLHIIEKGVSIGNFQYTRDLPLGVENYIEVEPIKVYGTIGWKPFENSDLQLLGRASASLGYAIGESSKPGVDNTSNMYVGTSWGVGLSHRRFGSVFLDRFVDGEVQKYDFNSTSSREAEVSFTYSYDFNERNNISFMADKRSFRFGPDYEKSKRYLITFTRRFK